MRGEGEEGEAAEEHPVEEAVDVVLGGQQHHEPHHELGVEDQEPGDDAAHDAAAVADEPHGVGAVAERGRGTVLGPQVASLALDVPGAVRRALHPTTPVAPTTCCEERGREMRRKQNYRVRLGGLGLRRRWRTHPHVLPPSKCEAKTSQISIER